MSVNIAVKRQLILGVLIAGRVFKIALGTGALVLAATFLFALTPFGGRVLWNLGNRNALRGDVLAVLRGQEVHPTDMDCRMIGTSRAGWCTFHATPKEANAIATKLRLTELPSYPALGRLTEHELEIPGVRIPFELDLPKLGAPFSERFRQDYPQVEQDYVAGKDVRCFVTTQASNAAGLIPNANLPHFHSLYLFYRPSTREISAEVEYPYG